MPKQININDPKAWRDLDWDEPQSSELLKRSDSAIAMGRPSRLRKETGEARKNAFKASKTRFSNIENVKKQSEIGKKIMTTNPHFLLKKEEARKKSMKPVVTPFGRFESYNEAQRNIPVDLSKKLKTLPHLYYYESDGPGPETLEKVYNTPFGSSNKRVDVYNLNRISKEINALNITHKAHWWNKMSKSKPKDYFISLEIAREWNKK